MWRNARNVLIAGASQEMWVHMSATKVCGVEGAVCIVVWYSAIMWSRVEWSGIVHEMRCVFYV